MDAGSKMIQESTSVVYKKKFTPVWRFAGTGTFLFFEKPADHHLGVKNLISQNKLDSCI